MRKRWIGWVENGLIAVLGIALAGAAIAVLSGNWQVQPVLSGSMRPAMQPGGVIIIQRVPVSQLAVGDIVVFHQPDNDANVVAHRIISARPVAGGMQVSTKGDANSVPDSWNPFLVRGPNAYKARVALPLIGFLAVDIRRYGPALLLFGAGVFLLYQMFKRLRSNPTS